MAINSRLGLRRLWLNIHLWIALILTALLVPIGLSGSLLVWHDHVDRLVSPSRYAVSGEGALTPSALLASAVQAAPQGFQPIALRLPEASGWPATVTVRGGRGEQQSGRPPMLTVYLDPPTGRVLGTVDFRNSLIGVLHRFHENLTIPEYSGRAIVGWAGVGLLILSLSGIYLWWPRSAGFRRGLRWRRGPTQASNIHHTGGFWIALPLAVVSLTGIYLGFPQQGRALLGSVAPMSTPQRGFQAQPMRQPSLSADSAIRAALDAEPGTQAAAVFLPSQQAQTWRVQLRSGNSDALTTLMVDDRTGVATRPDVLSGDRAAQWIRRIHEGSNLGGIWQMLVFLTGLAPTVFSITGIMIWLRRRRVQKANAGYQTTPQAGAGRIA